MKQVKRLIETEDGYETIMLKLKKYDELNEEEKEVARKSFIEYDAQLYSNHSEGVINWIIENCKDIAEVKGVKIEDGPYWDCSSHGPYGLSFKGLVKKPGTESCFIGRIEETDHASRYNDYDGLDYESAMKIMKELKDLFYEEIGRFDDYYESAIEDELNNNEELHFVADGRFAGCGKVVV